MKATTTLRIFTVFFGLFLSFPAAYCQWGFGLGKGGGWDFLWSNMGDLDKFDLNRNSDGAINNAISKVISDADNKSLRRRYGRFVQSVDSSDESDSSSEEISMGETLYSAYLDSKHKSNSNYENRLSRTRGKHDNEGEEVVNTGETGSGTGVANNGNARGKSRSGTSFWSGSSEKRSGVTGENTRNTGVNNYEKRSPHNRQDQQGRGRSSQNRGQGQQRYRTWAHYQRQQQMRNQGEEIEPEDVTPGSTYGQGHGGMGDYEPEEGIPQGGGQTQGGIGADHEAIEAEDRTTKPSVSNTQKTTTTQEYEAEDVTTVAPGGSVTSGRVTVRGRTAEVENEFEGRKTTTTKAPKKTRPALNTWESGINTSSGNQNQAGQGRKTQDTHFQGRWVEIGEKPYQRQIDNSKAKSGWTTYAGSVEHVNQGTKQTETNRENPTNEKEAVTKQESVPDSLSNGQTHPRTGNPDSQRTEGNTFGSAWLDTSPRFGANAINQDTNTEQQLNQASLIQQEFEGTRTTAHAKPSINANPAQTRPKATNRFTPMAQRPAQTQLFNPNGHTPTTVRSQVRGTQGTIRQPSHTGTPMQRKMSSIASNANVSPKHNVHETAPEGWVDPHPVVPRNSAPESPKKNMPPTNVHETAPEGWVDPKPLVPMTVTPNSRRTDLSPINVHQTAPEDWIDPKPVVPEIVTPIPSRTNTSPTNVHQTAPEGWVDPQPVVSGRITPKPSRINLPPNTAYKTTTEGWVDPKPVNTQTSNTDRNKHDWQNVQRHFGPQQRFPTQPSHLNNDNRQFQLPRQHNRVISKQESRIFRPTVQQVPSKSPMPENTGTNLTRRRNFQTIPEKKPVNSIPHQEKQPIFKDINSAIAHQTEEKGSHAYPQSSSGKRKNGNINIERPSAVDHVTEKPMVENTKVSKKPMLPETAHVTIAMKMVVSDPTAKESKGNQGGSNRQRGNFVFMPKPILRGHKAKGSRQTNQANKPDTPNVNQQKHEPIVFETSTFSVIKPKSKSSKPVPAIIRPNNDNRQSWGSDNNIDKAAVKTSPDRNRHMKNIKNLIDQQRPASVIKHFIEMTTENGLGASGSPTNTDLITNIDQTLSSDNPRVLNLLRDIERTKQQPTQDQGQQQKGLPRNDVIAKLSSTGVLGQHPNTIDMAPGRGSIVDGVDAEALLNSNTNLLGVISSSNHKIFEGNSIMDSQNPENTKSRTPILRLTGPVNDMQFRTLNVKVRRVNGEQRPEEEAVGLGKVVQGSKNSVKIVSKTHQSKNVNANSGAYSTDNVKERNISGGQKTVAKTVTNKASETISTDINNVHIDSNSASNNKQTTSKHVKTSVKSSPDSSPNLTQNKISSNSNTNVNAKSSSGSLTSGKSSQSNKYTPGTVERRRATSRQSASTSGQGSATAARVQAQALRRLQQPGGFGSHSRSGSDTGEAWKSTARSEARELALEKEGRWNSLSRGTKDKTADHIRRRLV